MKYLKDKWFIITMTVIFIDFTITGYFLYENIKRKGELDIELKRLEQIEKNMINE